MKFDYRKNNAAHRAKNGSPQLRKILPEILTHSRAVEMYDN